jgi:hypothetical protein
MKNETALNKRLTAYSALATVTAALPATQSAQAALIIHDVGQTIPGAGGLLYIDVDGGGVTSTTEFPGADLAIEAGFATAGFVGGGVAAFYSDSCSSTSCCWDWPPDPDCPIWCCTMPMAGRSTSALQLPASHSVGADGTAFYGNASRSWGGRGFIGIRFPVDGSDHFGWVDVEVNPDWSLTIHRVGWEDVSGAPAHCEAPPCPWDLDGDGGVGVIDFLRLLAQWGTSPGGPPDFDGDGTVGMTDFEELLSRWGHCPGPSPLGLMGLGAAAVTAFRERVEGR